MAISLTSNNFDIGVFSNLIVIDSKILNLLYNLFTFLFAKRFDPILQPILYINCVVCPWRDSYVVGSAFSVAEPAFVYYCIWLTAGECSSECIHARREWTEFSRRVSADHWTQRKVTIRAPIDDRRMESLMRGKNGRNSRSEFPPTTGHREKFCILCILLHLDD
jgi:hypothetical protein